MNQRAIEQITPKLHEYRSHPEHRRFLVQILNQAQLICNTIDLNIQKL